MASQFLGAGYLEDHPGFALDTGFRYQLQTTPGAFANFDPRIGLAWSPDKKETWVFHARAGLFSDIINPNNATDVYRVNGILQRQTTVYSPSYSVPLTPVPGSFSSHDQSIPVSVFSTQIVWAMLFNIEHDFAHHWHASGNFFYGENWGLIRTVNINAPMVPSCTGCSSDPRKHFESHVRSRRMRTWWNIDIPAIITAMWFRSASVSTATNGLAFRRDMGT